MLATLEGTSYVARMALDTPGHILKARKTILTAFDMQIRNMGFSFVELLAACPTNWGLSPLDAKRRLKEELIPYFPLGVFKEKETADYI
jgi:2-oxoglutarate ferredoxin oxidoreductase subunit beta